VYLWLVSEGIAFPEQKKTPMSGKVLTKAKTD